MNNFSVGASLHYGWETFKKRVWFFVGAFLLLGVIEWLLGALGQASQNDKPLYALVYLATIVLSVLIDMGVNAFLLKTYDNLETVSINDLWHPQPFWQFLGVALLSGLAIVVGLILLVIPGIIVILMFMFAKLLVIDRNLGPIEAMKESVRITKGHLWELLALYIVLFILNVIGAILLFVGLLVSIPVSALALVYAYRTLARAAKATPSTT
jgi:uncharacterized membrane protein